MFAACVGPHLKAHGASIRQCRCKMGNLMNVSARQISWHVHNNTNESQTTHVSSREITSYPSSLLSPAYLLFCTRSKPLVSSGFVISHVDDDLTATLSQTGPERTDENIQYAGPHRLDPPHVDEKELHAGHDQPARTRRGGQNRS